MKSWIRPAAGIVLIAAGAYGLANGKFSYTKEDQEVKLGGIELSFKDKETIDVPKWAGAGAIAAGVLLLLFGRKP